MTTPSFVDVTTGVVNKLARVGMSNLPNVQSVVDNHEVSFYAQGNFTVAVISNKKTGRVSSVGVSKRNPVDNKVPFCGKSYALTRAVYALVTQEN